MPDISEEYLKELETWMDNGDDHHRPLPAADGRMLVTAYRKKCAEVERLQAWLDTLNEATLPDSYPGGPEEKEQGDGD